MLNVDYFFTFIGDAAAYRVYVYMLYPLQGSRSTAVDLLPCKGYIHTICCRITDKYKKVINILTYNFSKKKCKLPEDDLRIETCRSILSVLV